MVRFCYIEPFRWPSLDVERLFRGHGTVKRVKQQDIENVSENCIIALSDFSYPNGEGEDYFNRLYAYLSLKKNNPVALFFGLSEPLVEEFTYTVVNLILKSRDDRQNVCVFLDPTTTDQGALTRVKTFCEELGLSTYYLEGFRNLRWGIEDPVLGDLKGTSAKQICEHYIEEARRERPFKFLFKTRRWDFSRALLFYRIVSDPKRFSRFELTANVGSRGKTYEWTEGVKSLCRQLSESQHFVYSKVCDVIDRSWYGFWNQEENGGPFIHEDSMFSVRKYFYLEVVGENYQFQTEKVFKPMLWGIPCFYLGAKGTLEILRRQGFQTFDEWWDERYDQLEYDDPEKVTLILEEVDKLLSRRPKDLAQMYDEMIPVFIHNAEQLDEISDNVKQAYEVLESLGKTTKEILHIV